MALDPPVPQVVRDHAFDAVFGLGELAHDKAVRAIAGHLRELGLIEPYKKLNASGTVYRHIETVVRACLDVGAFDSPAKGYVRAVKARAADYRPEDWRTALLAVMTGELSQRDEVIRDAAHWAQDNMGLQFKRLSQRSVIFKQLMAAIERAVVDGLVKQVAGDYVRKRL